MRAVLLYIFIIFHTLYMCWWGLFLSAFDKNGSLIHRWAAVPWARMIMGIAKILGIEVEIRGKITEDMKKAKIFMTNHQSYFDIFALLAYLPHDFRFIMKKELMEIPLLGYAMRKVGYIGIDRENPRAALRSLKEASDKLHHGISLLIFPEGTRSPDGSLLPFKKGGFKLAMKTGAEIVPIGIRGSAKIASKGRLRLRKGRFSIGFGPPIDSKKFSRRDIDRLMELTREHIKRLIEN